MPEIKIDPLDEDAVLREIWNTVEIEAKTELSDDQISHVNKLLTLSDLFGSTMLERHLTKFLILQKSRNRKSMDEFVNVVRAKREDFVNKGQSWFKSMMG